MASAFNSTANQLTQTQQQLDLNAQQQVQQINQITQQIAGLNLQLSEASSTGQDYASFEDQRNELIQQLSGLVDLSQVNTGNSVTLTTKQGTALVVGGQAYALTTATNSSGLQDIYSAQGEDITGEISGGSLGGTLQARDQTIPALETQLDSLASGLVQSLNTADKKGTDLNGNPGGNLFEPITGTGAAASMTLAFTDPTLLAAGSDGTSGSNGNIANLSGVANQSVSNGMTPSAAYSNMVFQVGSSVSNGTTELNASTAMLQQLQQQQSSVSGVSLDEEASNMLLYQRAYQASAEAISAVNQMLQTVINMGAQS